HIPSFAAKFVSSHCATGIGWKTSPARPTVGGSRMSVWDRFRLDGRRALITGGSRGLGRAMAQTLAEAGADLVLIGREEASLGQAQRELQELGRHVATIAADLSSPAEVEKMC